jgi:hypothetical protein
MATNKPYTEDRLTQNGCISEEFRTQLEILVEKENPMASAAERALELYT